MVTISNMKIADLAVIMGSENPKRDGSFDYYMSEPVVENDAKGVGPLLLAYTELRRLEGK